MVTVMKRRKTPEEEELSKKSGEFSELELELVQKELDLATLHGELRAFEARYLSIVGIRYAELDEIEAQVAELQALLAPKDKGQKESAKQARVKADESAQAVNIQKPLSPKGFSPSDNLKRLYREVAKSLHPDLANDEEERIRRGRFMAEANHAYQEGDEARLEATLRRWEISPDSVKGEGIEKELIRVIRKIAQVQERLRVIDTEISQLKKSDLYELKTKVEEVESEGRDLLGEIAFQLDEQINLAKQSFMKMKSKKSR
jgi:DnaJ-domain-containing protein 1